MKTIIEIELFYKNMIDALPHAIFMTDLNMNILFANQACCELFHLQYPECMGQPCSLCGTENCDTGDCCIRRMREGISDTTYIDNYYGKSLRVTTSFLRNSEGKHIGYTSTSVDITDLKLKEQKLKIQEERFRIAMPYTNCGIWEYDPVTKTLLRETSVNKNFNIPDISYNVPESLIETGMIHPRSVEELRDLFRKLDEGVPEVRREIVFYTRDMKIIWYRLTFTNVFNERGVPIKAIGVSKDITAQKEDAMQMERERRELLKEASTDALTGLYNRKFVSERMENYLENRKLDASGALFMIDVDDFKLINDQYGHQRGDEFLMQMAECMRMTFRKEDILCRMGGDEFLIFIDHVNKEKIEEKARQLCHKIYQMSKEYPAANGAGITCGISVGIAIVGKEAITFEELYRRADEALYRAKKSGKNKYLIYDADC